MHQASKPGQAGAVGGVLSHAGQGVQAHAQGCGMSSLHGTHALHQLGGKTHAAGQGMGAWKKRKRLVCQLSIWSAQHLVTNMSCT